MVNIIVDASGKSQKLLANLEKCVPGDVNICEAAVYYSGDTMEEM
jgi:hypothetical protein